VVYCKTLSWGFSWRSWGVTKNSVGIDGVPDEFRTEHLKIQARGLVASAEFLGTLALRATGTLKLRTQTGGA
jgi:hypothetical protein